MPNDNPIPEATRKAMALNLVADELEAATKEHGPMTNHHEAYGLICEEVEEYFDEVKIKAKLRSKERLRDELVQVAAMACRAIVDLC